MRALFAITAVSCCTLLGCVDRPESSDVGALNRQFAAIASETFDDPFRGLPSTPATTPLGDLAEQIGAPFGTAQEERVERASPSLEISTVSPVAGLICGKVRNRPQPTHGYCVVCYVLTDIWYVHPFLGSKASIKEDGTWAIQHVPRGGERLVAAVLVPRAIEPPAQLTTLSVLPAVAETTVPYPRD